MNHADSSIAKSNWGNERLNDENIFVASNAKKNHAFSRNQHPLEIFIFSPPKPFHFRKSLLAQCPPPRGLWTSETRLGDFERFGLLL